MSGARTECRGDAEGMKICTKFAGDREILRADGVNFGMVSAGDQANSEKTGL